MLTKCWVKFHKVATNAMTNIMQLSIIPVQVVMGVSGLDDPALGLIHKWCAAPDEGESYAYWDQDHFQNSYFL